MHRELCHRVLEWLIAQTDIDLGCVELGHSGGIVDVIGLSTRQSKKPYKILVVEVKRTRSDLLRDLASKKMLKYEKSSTHCYLAGTYEAFGSKDHKQILADLQLRGLPGYWGVLALTANGCYSIRKTTRHKTLSYRSVVSLTRKIARSYMYRSFRNT